MSDRPAGPPEPLIRAEGVSRVYPDGAIQAVVDLSLCIGHGQFLAILGPSGSGKSTLLNLLGCIDRATTGEIYFEGQPVSAIRSLHRLRAQKIGFVFQSFFLLATLSARENVRVPLVGSGLTSRQRTERVDALLEWVGVAHRARHLPSRLSVGERQRVAIARALVNEPSLVLADEPTGNLDSRNTANVLDLFDRLHRERRTTLVVVTHSEAVAERAQRVVRMEDGRIIHDRERVWAHAGPLTAGPRAPASTRPVGSSAGTRGLQEFRVPVDETPGVQENRHVDGDAEGPGKSQLPGP
jgi:putative ABC transport system ATP-binding protein